MRRCRRGLLAGAVAKRTACALRRRLPHHPHDWALTCPPTPPLRRRPSPPLPRSEPVWESCLNRTLAVGGAAFDLDAVWAAPLDTT